MTQPRLWHLPVPVAGATARLAVHDWGDPGAPPLLCVHGLTRNGRDFDALAEALAPTHRVLCADLPGRGASDWLPDPSLYTPATYVPALAALLGAIGRPAAYLGTSLGGICGMALAADPTTPITRLVLNDVGPRIPMGALARIRDYLAAAPASFADAGALEAHLRRVHAPFGPLTDAQWRHLAVHSARLLPDGALGLHYDPAIATPIVGAEPADIDLGEAWAAIRIPVLALRGEHSDLLTPEIFAAMHGVQRHTVPGAGHAPALMDAPTIAVITRFLAA